MPDFQNYEDIYGKNVNVMKKNFFEWIAYVLLFLWQLPQNLVGLGMLLYFKLKGDLSVRVTNKYSKVYDSKYMYGGISLGTFAFIDKYYPQNSLVPLHEQGHMWDSKVMGPLYLFIVGIPSILNAAFDFTECYYDFFCEAWANKHAGLEADENCRLRLKEQK